MAAVTNFFISIILTISVFFSSFSIALNDRRDKAPISPAEGAVKLVEHSGWGTAVYPTADGALIAGMEKPEGVATKKSYDGGETWENEQLAGASYGLTCGNVEFYQMGDTLYLAYRAIGHVEGGFYTSLRVSQSKDYGDTWAPHSIVIENLEPTDAFYGTWEPCLGEIDGKLVCVYANDSTSVTSRQNIESLTWNGSEWTDKVVISNGEKHDSRDGMPVWIPLQRGGYVCVIESTKYRKAGYPWVIQMLYSPDGRKWSEPRDVYIPSTKGSKAAAPWIAQLPDGRLVVTFQTDEDKAEKGDATSVSKLIYTTQTCAPLIGKYAFTSPKKIFPDEFDAVSAWGRLYVDGDTLYYTANTALGGAFNTF